MRFQVIYPSDFSTQKVETEGYEFKFKAILVYIERCYLKTQNQNQKKQSKTKKNAEKQTLG
jgi:hypothetical protein